MNTKIWIVLTTACVTGVCSGFAQDSAPPQPSGEGKGRISATQRVSPGIVSAPVTQVDSNALSAPTNQGKGRITPTKIERLSPGYVSTPSTQGSTNGISLPTRIGRGNGAAANMGPAAGKGRGPTREQVFEAARGRMLTNQISARGLATGKPELLAAVGKVPRHQFVPGVLIADAYQDKALDIGYGRTVASPYTVAAVADQINAKGDERVLEIGTGSGYQTAVLAQLAKEVYSVESSFILAERAATDLKRLGYTNNIFLRQGDPALGWPDAGPFDAIIVNDGNPDEIAPALRDQLKEGGRLIIAGLPGSKISRAEMRNGQIGSRTELEMQPAGVVREENRVELFGPLKANPVSGKARGKSVEAEPSITPVKRQE